MLYGVKIKELREENELTQTQVAKILDIYKGTYNQYETEYIIIPVKHLNTLANFYKVSIDFLFGFSNCETYVNIKNDINKEVSGNRLKNLRKKQKLTQNKMAEKLNISRTTIAEYERGTNILATPFLYTISKIYHISADYLLGKTDEPQYL